MTVTANAAAQTTTQLAESGWFSDDTRADGSGIQPAGTDLVSTTLTDAPESGFGIGSHDADIRSQIKLGDAAGGVPAGTHRGALHLKIAASGAGKSQASHRKDDGVGHASGADAFGPATWIEYSWMGDGTTSVTASFKLGVKTAEFAGLMPSSRTGENAWDKVMVYEPGNGNGAVSDGTWRTETIDFATGRWWLFDRQAGAGTIGAPMTLLEMSTSAVPVGGGGKTVADVYALITAPGAHVTSAQFGVGSGNAGASVYINELTTNFYRAGSTTRFGAPSLEYDQDATNAAIFGSGNLNGSFTTDRSSSVELALRGKLRFNASGMAVNQFNSNGDGTYTFETGAPTGGAGWVAPSTPFWNFEWSVNSDFDGASGAKLDDLSYELGIDFDPGTGTNFQTFDPIDPASSPANFWDHSIGDNATPDGGGAEATDPASYAALIANNNLAQQSWSVEFFNDAPFDTFDPNVEGDYEFYFAAFDAMGNEVARTSMTILARRPLEFDQNVTNEVIFGSGNANGGFTVDRASGVEVALRNKVRFPVPANDFRSNGDGTYTFSTGARNAMNPLTPLWAFEWSANTDFDGSTARQIDDYTYELGIDFDPSANTNFLAFDHVTPGATIPYTTPAVVPFWDHAIGTNATGNGGGAVALDVPTYVMNIGANNLVQNSWRMDFFDNDPYDTFDPTVPGQYDFYLAAFDGGVEVARTEIRTFVLDGASLTLEGAPCQGDLDPGTPGVQVAVTLNMRNVGQTVTGYQAFLEYDTSLWSYEGTLSSYSDAPFDANITPIQAAEVAPGELRVDGNAFTLPPTSDDALLATLVFTVATECTEANVIFDTDQPFQSELSFMGSPLMTSTLDSATILADASAPVIAPMADITTAADAGVNGGCDSAVVNYVPPSFVDTCTSATLVCTPPPGTAFPVGTTVVNCVATDDCGNTSVESFGVTVTATNRLMVDIELTGVQTPVTRCLHFTTDDCLFTDVPVSFVDHDLSAATPVRGTAMIEIPCGDTSSICVKDEQHTKWATTTVSLIGTDYLGDTLVSLDGGDTDNDGDIDINDVTLFIAQFGSLAASGGCAWDGTRDADFDNDGAVGSSDYGFLTSGWLTTSQCACSSPSGGAAGIGDITMPSLSPRVAASTDLRRRADLNGDGWVDATDVRILEARMGLSGELSRAIRSTR